ncbi:stealth family protein [Streptomyces xinghaiensis]|uniref:stealth family protein n=1 Tax=Streptomyces xinghaiensis TaxID=1038928 RepID=UPI003423FF6C
MHDIDTTPPDATRREGASSSPGTEDDEPRTQDAPGTFDAPGAADAPEALDTPDAPSATTRAGHRNPEVSWPVRLYRRSVPVRLRRAVVARTSPAARARAKRWFTTVPSPGDALGRLRAAHAVRRHPDLFRGPDRALRMAGGAPRAVLVTPDPTPLGARNANAARVRDALDTAGVDHFSVRGRRDTSAVVAVAAADRARAHRALARACADAPGYVTAVEAGERLRRTAPGFRAATWRAVAEADVIRLTWYHGDPEGRLVLGPKYGCDVEFWAAGEETGDTLTAPRHNRTAEVVPRTDDPVEVSETLFTALAPPARPLPPVRTRKEFARPAPEDVRFPVDAVYTWVDGHDPDWLARRAATAGHAYHEEAANAARYASHDELRYSLRSLHLYAPWLRTIHLVTDRQVPPWLDRDVPGLRVVDHTEIFGDPGLLPTFNSHAIESQVHHIEGLSEHFLYFNDDVFLGRPTRPQDFFHANGLTQFFPSPALIPPGAPNERDVPVSAAGKNNRALIEEMSSTVIGHKMKHTPHALRRSVLYEIEERFPEQHRATASRRFRSLDDLSVVSSLHHYYAFLTARAVPGQLRYAYLDISDPVAGVRLDRLLARRDRTVFCLNDTVSGEEDVEAQRALLTPFLEAYFPVPGPYERGAVSGRTGTGREAGAGTVDGSADGSADGLAHRQAAGPVADGTAHGRAA